VYDVAKYGELFGARHLADQKYVERFGTEKFNEKLKNADYGKAVELPPYGYKKNVLLFQIKKDNAPDFVRLYNDDLLQGLRSSRDGAWMVLRKDLDGDIKGGLNVVQIRDKYGLPNVPTKVVDVRLPGGVKMAVGKANKIEFNSQELGGGGRQYQVLRRPPQEWFPEDTVRGLDEYIKSVQSRK
jgi:hypothetical protein